MNGVNMIITVANVKGGVGKSCLAQNIAVYLVQQGKRVHLVDCDKQETTADWLEARDENNDLSEIPFSVLSGKLRDNLFALEKAYDVVVVDSGGQDSDTMRYALAASTHVLMPFRTKRRDIKALPLMRDIVDMILAVNPDCIFKAIVSQAPTLPSMHHQIFTTKQMIQEFGFEVLDSVIFNRNSYDYSEENGASVLEWDDAKAKEEVTLMMKEFLGEL